MKATTVYSLKIEADSETHAEEIADETPIEDWHTDFHDEGLYEIEEMESDSTTEQES
jgi:hypothetical protein